jgi:hypothetical protein
MSKTTINHDRHDFTEQRSVICILRTKNALGRLGG